MRTQDEIRDLLAQKFSKEKKRLKSWKTPCDSFQLANVVTQYVRALMSESRKSELKRLIKKIPKLSTNPYVQERLKATSQMADLIKRVAEDNESKRPWKSSSEYKQKLKNAWPKGHKSKKHRSKHGRTSKKD